MRIFLISHLIFACISIASAQSWKTADELNITKEQYLPNFNEIHNLVTEHYCHLQNKKIDSDILKKKYSDLIQTTDNKEQYIQLLLKYFAELHNSHTNLYVQPYFAGMASRLVEGKLLISFADQSDFEHYGVSLNDEIIDINGIPALTWIENEKQYVSSSTDADRTMRTVWRVFRNEFKREREFLINTKNGVKKIKISLDKTTFPSNNSGNSKTVESNRFDGGIGYLAINSMTHTKSVNVVTDFRNELEKVRDLPSLIVDLRTNGGGSSHGAELVTSFLLQKKQRACVSRKWIKPNRNRYTGKIVVLTNVYTFSAAESFTLDLKESGNAKLIGTPTGGDTGNEPKTFTTTYGFTFRIPTRKPPQVSFKGFPMEGVGIPPDITVERKLTDYLEGKDTVLEYAKNYLLGK